MVISRIILLLMILMSPFVLSLGVDIPVPVPIFDNNTAFVNSSANWITISFGALDNANLTQFFSNAGELNILESYLESFGDGEWLNLSGGNANQNINIGVFDFTTTGAITTGTLLVTGDSQLGNTVEGDTVGINTAPVSNQMLTGAITQSSEVGSGVEVIGIKTNVIWSADSNGGSDSSQGYGHFIDFDISGDDGTTNEEGKNSFGILLDIDDTSTFSFNDVDHATTGIDLNLAHTGGTTGFSNLANTGMKITLSGNTVSGEKIGLDINQVLGSTFSTIGIKIANVGGGSSSNFGILDTSNTDWALDRDNKAICWGASQDGCIEYNGTDLIIDPDLVGTGQVFIGATGDDDLVLNDLSVAGVINLPTTTTTTGIINVNGRRFMHSFSDDDPTSNVFLGDNAGNLALTTAGNNVGIGQQALRDLTTGSSNVALGRNAGLSITTGSNNFILGTFSMDALTTGIRNVAVGVSVMSDLVSGNSNIAFGFLALNQILGSENIGIGESAGRFVQTGNENVFIGDLAGAGSVGHNKSGNVFIGNQAGQNEERSNLLYIANTNTATPLIYGNFTSSELTFNGNLNVTGNLTSDNNITSKNVFIPQYENAHTNFTIPVLGSGTWTNITIAQEDSAISFGITHTHNDATNQSFTFTTDGVYEINYNLDIEDTSVGATNIDVAGRVIYVNGTEIIGSVFEIDVTKQATEFELSHDFSAHIKSGETIIFQFIGDNANIQISTHGTFGDHPTSASIKINKIANLPI